MRKLILITLTLLLCLAACSNHNKGMEYYKLADKYQDSATAILHDGIHGNYSETQIDSISKRADSLERVSIRYADSMNYYFDK